MKRSLLALINFSETVHAAIAEHFDMIDALDPASRAQAIAGPASQVAVVLTNGAAGLTAEEMRALPQLQLVCSWGVGCENIDLAHARAHGIEVATGAGTNDNCVADHAMGLLLASVRHIPALDRITRAGGWRDSLPLQPQLAGKRLGIVGLGQIGKKIARRAAGFDIEVAYCNRKPRDDVHYRYFADLMQLAAWADFLIVAAPGGASTQHMISTAVLDALGPWGYLVNIGRGSVVDTAALAAALRAGRLGGAALDVYESEPQPPAELIDLPNVVLTPHLAGRSPDAMDACLQQFLGNCAGHFAGTGPLVRA